MNVKREVIKGGPRCSRKLNLGEEVDNFSPANRIVSDFNVNNAKAARYYAYNLRPKPPKTKEAQLFHTFVFPGHPLNTFPDDWDGDLTYEYFEQFNYRSLRPKMITPLRNLEKNDPVTEYMEQKNQWHNSNSLFKSHFQRCNLEKQMEDINEEVKYCSKMIVDAAEHLEDDPIPYFDCSYNWHYAGNGNMQLVCIDWIDYILHSEFSSVSLTRFYSDNFTLEFNNNVSFDCGKDNNILETICSSDNIVALRTMYKVFILKIITKDDKLQFVNIKTIDSKLVFTGINFDGHHKNILYVITLDCKLTIVNLDRMTGRSLTCRYNNLLNNWNTVIGAERSYFTHVRAGDEGGCISIYDKRTNNIVEDWKNLVNICDTNTNIMSAASQRENTPFMYVTTNHHIFMIDLRYKPRPPTAVQRWTHGSQCVPAYITRCNFELGKELICLTSQWSEDMCVMPNYIERQEKCSRLMGVTIPYRPPTMLDTLKAARSNFFCSDIYNNIDRRLANTITGISAIEQSDKYVILMQNSLGDISCHLLYPRHLADVMEDDSFKCLEEWSKFNRTEKKYHVSQVVNIKRVLNKLLQPLGNIDAAFCSTDNDPTKFDEDEIYKTFESPDMDKGLLEIWTKDAADEEPEDQNDEANSRYEDGSSDRSDCGEEREE